MILLVLFPLVSYAQKSGGQIKRNKTTRNVSSTNSKLSTSKNRILQNLIKNMVFVEGGSYYMGGTSEQEGDMFDNEKPIHYVTLSSFYIGKYEVTQEEWQTVMGDNPSEFKGAKRPVENVSWNECQVFIKKLNVITGKHFRLPTEAEWEYAARGGKYHGYKYSGSDYIDDVAWYTNNRTYDLGTSIVGQLSHNNLGLYDMSGNVAEWCYDWYDLYDHNSKNNFSGPRNGTFKVFRGGGWGSSAKSCRVSCRDCGFVSDSSTFLGLRLAL